MATAKLWWDGDSSSWVTSSAYWINDNTMTGSSYYGIRFRFQIIAYEGNDFDDDPFIQFSGTIDGIWSNNVWCNGSLSIKANNDSVTSFSLSETHSLTKTGTIPSPTATVKYDCGSGSGISEDDLEVGAMRHRSDRGENRRENWNWSHTRRS